MRDEIFDGKYRITGELGSGGMSSVYRCTDLFLNREVALKVLRTERVLDEKSLRRFQSEGRAIARLNHENIVKMHGLQFTADHQPYLTMEVVDGRDLEKIIEENGPMECEVAVSIARQIAAALAYVHSQKIIHRDLKPANIMLNDANKIKLLDFGIAKFLEEQSFKATRTGESIGTPTYMSPEQSMGKAVDARSDQYSLGCVLFEMLTGRPPYQAETNVALTLAHAQDEIPSVNKIRRDKISQKLEAMIAQLLAKHPEDRFTDMVMVRELLERFEKSGSSRLSLTGSLIALTIALVVLGGASYVMFTSSFKHPKKADAAPAKINKIASDENFSLKNSAKSDNAEFAKFIAEHPHIQKIDDEFKTLAVDDDGLSVIVGHNSLKDISLTRWIMLTDKSADYLSGLPLIHLAISRTNLSDGAIKTFEKLKNLKHLDISHTKITDKSCEYLSKFDSLRTLNISEDSITDEGLQKLGKMPNLEYLFLSRTQVKDIAHSLQTNNVRALGIEGLDLRKEDFVRLAHLKRLNSLNLSDATYNPENLFLLDSPVLQYIAVNSREITPEQMSRLRQKFSKVEVQKPHFSSYF